MRLSSTRPEMMWQISEESERSAVKRPGVHSQMPISTLPSGDWKNERTAST